MTDTAVLLEGRALRREFGGVVAVRDVSLCAREGETVSIIGPNGAGKTTLFNLLTGLDRPDAGQVHFSGQDVTHLPPDRRAALGIARTFQHGRPFGNLSVLDNVLIGRLAHVPGWRSLIGAWPKKDIDIAFDDLLEILQLAQEHAQTQRLQPADILIGACYSNALPGAHWAVRQVIDAPAGARPRDPVIYKTVAGAGSGSTGVCKRHELASWAAHAVAAESSGWIRVAPAESAARAV